MKSKRLKSKEALRARQKLMLYLLDRMGNDGYAVMLSVRELASACDLRPTFVHNALDSWRKRGLITVHVYIDPRLRVQLRSQLLDDA